MALTNAQKQQRHRERHQALLLELSGLNAELLGLTRNAAMRDLLVRQQAIIDKLLGRE
jgi:hypothetical protein